MFKKVLVANRGEIAVRILRTLREMEIRSVAVYSEADRSGLHVRRADEAYLIGPPAPAQSYLDIARIIDVARRAGADALHPGYGFLAESADLREACDAAGITFIGPPASAIRVLGLKTSAREAMSKSGVPVVPGGPASTLEQAEASARAIGYPILLKASAGGGGKGMRRVEHAEELPLALERARGEAEKAFGDPSIYIEKALSNPRHVEIQVLGDRDGNLVHLYERDCSIQRRHQKIVEETPSPAVAEARVEQMAEVALRGARAVGYYSAGTFEFLVDADEFYFLEMNTRLQVEHPITELVTGIDLVQKMLCVAAGEPLGIQQSELARRGAAIECRLYAEDPARGFLPAPGTIRQLIPAGGPGVREDSGVQAGSIISGHYDPLISKLCAWAPDRAQAVSRMRRALGEYLVTGVRTNIAFLQQLFEHSEYVAGRYDTGFVERYFEELCRTALPRDADAKPAAAAIAVAAYNEERKGSPPAKSLPSPWLAAHRFGRRG